LLSFDSENTTFEIEINMLGYVGQVIKVNQSKNFGVLKLNPEQGELKEVLVVEERNGVFSTQMSVETITAKDIKNIPALLGEIDVLRVLQLKPGIQNAGEGSSGLYVRGGGPDQNLMLLDEAQVYNANHLFGFFSVFNSDAVESIDVYKGGFPAKYGGKLSSVIDVRLKNGNKEKFSGTGGIGLISSRLTLETPLQKGKSSLMLAGRRTYIELLTERYNDLNRNNPKFNPIPMYYFYDLNAKADYFISDKDKIFINSYYGRDVFRFRRGFFSINFDWGNTANTVKWLRTWNKKLTSSTSFVYSKYDYRIRNAFGDFGFSLRSSVDDLGLKSDWEYNLSNETKMSFGVYVMSHSFVIGQLNAGSSRDSLSLSAGKSISNIEQGAYANLEHDLTARWKVNVGLRLSSAYNSGVFYGFPEPRFSIRYRLDELSSFKASYTYMNQYLHLAGNSGATLPTDIWYPSTPRVKPERSQQWAIGYQKVSNNRKYFISSEVYYKDLLNQIDYRDGALLAANPRLEDEFVFGRGWSYGWEAYLEKKKGKTTGWIGYTLSWTWRQFDEINNGRKFNPKNDRRHDISAVLMRELSPRLSASLTWVFGNGPTVTMPIGKFVYQGVEGSSYGIAPIYGDRNNYRLIDYHRMDVGLVWKFKPKWGESDLTFSIYNLYDRRNAYFIYFEPVLSEVDQELITGFQAVQVSLFPMVPAFTYNFKF
ncbi:MAG: TonB-dependent receptor plug domain-containing protein, partial [Cytophagales bacterium]